MARSIKQNFHVVHTVILTFRHIGDICANKCVCMQAVRLSVRVCVRARYI